MYNKWPGTMNIEHKEASTVKQVNFSIRFAEYRN